MSKKRIISIIFIYLLLSIGYTQTRLASQETLFYLPQGFVLDALSGYGYNKSTKSSISNILAGNPANNQDFDNITIGFSYQFDSKIGEAWIVDFGHSRTRLSLPQSAAVIVPYNNFRFGIGMNQLYNSELDYGTIYAARLNPDSAQGYIDIVIHPKKEVIIFRNSISASYCFSEHGSPLNSLCLGIQFNSNYLSYKFNLGYLAGSDPIIPGTSEVNKDFFANNFNVGFRYGIKPSAGSAVVAGVYYESAVDYDIADVADGIRYIGHIPAKSNFGIMFEPNINFNFSGDLSYIFWEDIDTDHQNRLEFAFNSCFRLSYNLSVSTGIFHTDRVYRNVDSDFDFNRFEANYLIGGITFRNDWFSFELAIADSRLVSDEWREQYIIKSGLGFQL